MTARQVRRPRSKSSEAELHDIAVGRSLNASDSAELPALHIPLLIGWVAYFTVCVAIAWTVVNNPTWGGAAVFVAFVVMAIFIDGFIRYRWGGAK